MRLSSNNLYETGVNRLLDLQQSLAKTNNQINAGRRVLTPSDDPVAASRALQVTQASDINSQYVVNRQNARTALSGEETALDGVGSLLRDVRDVTLAAGNATITDADRMSYGAALRGQFEQLMGLANTTDGTGKYIFSGYQTATQAYSKIAVGAQYQGDQGQRVLQVDTTRQLPISDSGDAVFGNIKSGNGSFATAAAAANTGTGLASIGNVTNPAALTNHNYSVTFNVVAGVTTYDVVDNTVGLPALSTGNAYVSGQQISFGGMQFDISGAPANGDAFTVQPSTNENIFKTIDDLITLLQTPTPTGSAKTALTAGLAKATGNIDKALDNVSTTLAAVGTRQKELDSLDDVGSARDLGYQQNLQDLTGLDLVKAYTDLTQQQTILDAAQKSFIKTSGLSLFNYL